jgi:hypothetical protein
MSNERDDGGPAFPCLPPLGPDGLAAAGYPYVAAGMSLRDYFAAKAMQALITGRSWAHLEGHGPGYIMESWATGAYQLADEMLKARKEPTT